MKPVTGVDIANPSFRSAGHPAGAYLLRVQRPIQWRLAQLIIGQDAVVLPPVPWPPLRRSCSARLALSSALRTDSRWRRSVRVLAARLPVSLSRRSCRAVEARLAASVSRRSCRVLAARLAAPLSRRSLSAVPARSDACWRSWLRLAAELFHHLLNPVLS